MQLALGNGRIYATQHIESCMEKIEKDIKKWESEGKLPTARFFDNDKAFIWGIKKANMLASKGHLGHEDLLDPGTVLSSRIVLSQVLGTEYYSDLIERRDPISDYQKKKAPLLWNVRFFDTDDLYPPKMGREPKMRLVEAEKIENAEPIQEYITKYIEQIAPSRFELLLRKGVLVHPDLRNFLWQYCAEHETEENSIEEVNVSAFSFQMDYEDIRLNVQTENGETYEIPSLPSAPKWDSLSGMLDWLKEAKRVSDTRMSENLLFRRSSENPNAPYAVMDVEDVLLLTQNPFYSFKWYVDGNESTARQRSFFPLEDYYPDCTYEISHLAYRFHKSDLVLGVPDVNNIYGDPMLNAIDANINVFRSAVEHGLVSSALSVETYIPDPIHDACEETFQYKVAGDGVPNDGEFFFTCDRTGFGDEHSRTVMFDLEGDYPSKSFRELVDIVNERIAKEIREQDS